MFIKVLFGGGGKCGIQRQLSLPNSFVNECILCNLYIYVYIVNCCAFPIQILMCGDCCVKASHVCLVSIRGAIFMMEMRTSQPVESLSTIQPVFHSP